MDFATQQKQFDDLKWYESIVAGCDLCGSYDFCSLCDKTQSYPCARSMAKAKGEAVLAEPSAVAEEIACASGETQTSAKRYTKLATLYIKIR